VGTYAHIITPNKATRLPERVAILAVAVKHERDTNALSSADVRFAHASTMSCRLSRGEMSDCRRDEFSDADTVLAWLDKLPMVRHACWLIGSNLYRSLTVCGVWQACTRGRWTVETWIADNPPTVFVLRKGNARLICADTLNYWVCSEREFIRAAGVPAQDYHPGRASQAESEEYAGRLCEATLYHVIQWIKLCQDNDFGHWGCTIGSTAYHAWRHGRMGCQVHVHSDRIATKLERTSYYGGRADCHVIGPIDEEIYHVDVNSLYPSVAVTTPLPVRFLRTVSTDVETVRKYLADGYGVVACCQIHSGDYEYPKRKLGVPQYARGQFHTVLAGPELSRGIECGEVRSVGLAAIYECGYPCRSVLLEWYAARLAARQAKRVATEGWYKGCLNSLIGKFAQKCTNWVDCEGIVPAACWSQWYEVSRHAPAVARYMSFGSTVKRQGPSTEWHDSVVALTSYVNSAGRVIMHNLKQIAGVENVYYEDTDSLHVNRSGFLRLADHDRISSSAIGGLKLVRTEPNGVWRGVRDYSLGTIRVHAGVSPAAEEQADHSVLDTRRVLIPDPDNPLFPLGWKEEKVTLRFQQDRYKDRLDANGRVRPLTIIDV